MFCAHIREEDGIKQTILEHLENTALLAQEFAHSFGGDDYAYTTGLLHDIGKYSKEFQNRILHNGRKCDHSTAGAKEIYKLNKSGKLMSYCVAGHHSGLPNCGSITDVGIEGTLNARLNKNTGDIPLYDQFINEIDINKLGLPIMPNIKSFDNNWGFTISVFIRFIYSCLVDADFLDTEAFMSNYSIDRSANYDFNLFQKKLNDKLKSFKSNSKINEFRASILNSCIEKADFGRGLFNLTVPTGGGKTVSSLAFAVNHLIKNSMERIIYVIPYTSIIEQNAKEFKDILGNENVLEHHSNFDFEDGEDSINGKLKLSSENWDMPIIVTTNVQFFESLFENKSSRCRKLHNISNSIIIFDEVQMLPIDYLNPCIAAIKQLVQNYNSTVVMCSATQPAFEKMFSAKIVSKEICENYSELYDAFKRTKIIKREMLESKALADEMNAKKQVLCIVNTRKHAIKVFSMIENEGSYHLSTLMCPAHRKEVIKTIKQRLKDNLPCRVCSTRLIEAGVDVDFPIVYRAMAGLDSIIQSAGRCNREGKLTVEGKLVLGEVHVFEPEAEFVKRQPDAFKRPIMITYGIMRNFEDTTSPQAIKAYFEQLYEITGDGLDQKKILEKLESDVRNFNFNFEDIAHDFKIIDDTTIPIIIPYDDKACSLIEKLKYAEHVSGILRSLQGYTVSVYENEFQKLFGMGAFDFITKDIVILKEGLFNDLYDKNTGLNVVEETGIGIYI